MSNYFPPDDEDLVFFHKAMSDVRRHKRLGVQKSQKQSPLADQPPKYVKKKAAHHDIFLFDPAEPTLATEDALFFRRQGPQNKLIRKLVRGEIKRTAYLDLHGMTIEQARVAVENFLLTNQKMGVRCVKIIHGKGLSSKTEPKLKNYVNHWLKQFSEVLAFASARSNDGGTGAVYILLAKSKFLPK